jgi:hypothetical protein
MNIEHTPTFVLTPRHKDLLQLKLPKGFSLQLSKKVPIRREPSSAPRKQRVISTDKTVPIHQSPQSIYPHHVPDIINY